MFTEFKHTLRRLRGQLIGWGAGLFLYDIFLSSFFSTVQEMGDQMNELLAMYPPEMMAFFPEMMDFASPTGYLDTYFFGYMMLIIGFFATGACARLLVGDEENGVLDLLMAHPISRTSMFWGRVLGYVVVTAGILFFAWLGVYLPSESSGLGFTGAELAKAFLPQFSFLLLFGGFAMLMSMLLPSAKIAAGVSNLLLIGNFLMVGFSGLNEDLKPIYEASPFYFTQGAKAIENLNTDWLYGLLSFALLFFVAGWFFFQRRDIRVGGEGGWRLPSWMLIGAKAK